jgi:hypothetical protein
MKQPAYLLCCTPRPGVTDLAKSAAVYAQEQGATLEILSVLPPVTDAPIQPEALDRLEAAANAVAASLSVYFHAFPALTAAVYAKAKGIACVLTGFDCETQLGIPFSAQIRYALPDVPLVMLGADGANYLVGAERPLATALPIR